jgi:cation diffusion facilitator CzcD-associated flavoprotein CzcO
MLADLEARVRSDLAAIEHPPRGWLQPRTAASGQRVHDVVVVGAGLSGLTIVFGLMRQSVADVVLIDQAEPGDEGPWLSTAQMDTLRSPKTLTGPDLGIASLTFRAWYEARHGAAAFAALDKIGRIEWAAYLDWYRRTLGIAVRNVTRLAGIEPDGAGLRLAVEMAGRPETLLTRKVVLATGIEGNGGRFVPAVVADSLPPDRYVHSGERCDASRLRGRRVAVLGAAASAFDCAVTALRHGADAVHLLARRQVLPHAEVLAWTNFPGFLGHFSELDDLRRWRFMKRVFELQAPPTEAAFAEATGDPRFRLHLGAPLEAAALEDGAIVLRAGATTVRAEFLMLGTGYVVDLARRSELAALQPHVALWRDRFTPPAGEEHLAIANFPYLDRSFAFTEKQPGNAPWLRHVHNFNIGAVPSLGPVCNGITGLKYGVPKLVAGVVRGLFLDEADRLYGDLLAYDEGVRLTPEPERSPAMEICR